MMKATGAPGLDIERFWLRRTRVKLRRESIGFVFQQFYLMPTLTAGENIQLPLLFSELNRQGMTLVVVTHNLDLARRAERMYTLRDGQIVSCEERAYAEGFGSEPGGVRGGNHFPDTTAPDRYS